MYSLDQDKSFPVTDGLSDVSDPVFDANGKYLYFFGSTDAGPVRDWFAMSNADMRVTSALYLAVLRKDTPSPLAKESDEEKKKDDKPAEKPAEKPAARRGVAASVRSTSTACRTGSSRCRLRRATSATSRRARRTRSSSSARSTARPALHHYDLATRKDETLLPEVMGYSVSADGKKILYRSGAAWAIGPSKGRIRARARAG